MSLTISKLVLDDGGDDSDIVSFMCSKTANAAPEKAIKPFIALAPKWNIKMEGTEEAIEDNTGFGYFRNLSIYATDDNKNEIKVGTIGIHIVAANNSDIWPVCDSETTDLLPFANVFTKNGSGPIREEFLLNPNYLYLGFVAAFENIEIEKAYRNQGLGSQVLEILPWLARAYRHSPHLSCLVLALPRKCERNRVTTWLNNHDYEQAIKSSGKWFCYCHDKY